MSSRLLLAACLIGVGGAGCAHRSMGFPGPLGSLGSEPVPYEVDEPGMVPADEPAGPSYGRPRHAERGDADVARSAARFVGERKLTYSGDSFRYDCSGLVEATYAAAGRPVRGSTADLFEQARSEGVLHRHKRPRPGDLAFFDDTLDRNRNGRRDDPLTHVAIVESVDRHDTITLVHLGGGGVARIRMNLRRPHDHADEDGNVVNDWLRSGKDDGGPRLTGELWRAFGSLWDSEGAEIAQAEPEG